MKNVEDFYGGLSKEEYRKETDAHFREIEKVCEEMNDFGPERVICLSEARKKLVDKYNSPEVLKMDKTKRMYFRRGIAASLKLLDELAYDD